MNRQSTDISASGPPSFEVSDLYKSFAGETMVNDGISLRVEPGEVCGLLGPNGADKTTLVKQIIGLLKPDSGLITLGGYDLVADPSHARQLCSFLPQAAMPIESFKSREAVDLAGQIRGGDRPGVRMRRWELSAALDLDEWSDTLGANLSGGVRRLVGFVMTAVWPGPLVILDEPTNDVDPLRRRLLWEQIRRLGDTGAAVILATHNVLEAEKSVDGWRSSAGALVLVLEVEPQLRRTLAATFGPEVGREAAAEALAYRWARWGTGSAPRHGREELEEEAR